MKLLTYSTLFPNDVNPNHGIFVERRLQELQRRAGFDAAVVAPVPWFPFTSRRFGRYAEFAGVSRFENRQGVDAWHPRYPVIPKIGMSIAPLLLAGATASTCTAAARRNGPFDIVDAHYLYPDGVAAAFVARRLGLPLVLTARGSDVNVLAEFSAPRRWILWAAEHAAAVVAVSGALAGRLIEIGVRDDKVHVVTNGVDLDFFAPSATQQVPDGKFEQELYFLSVGTLVEAKGHHLAIEFVAGLPNARLAIVGSGPDETVIRQLIAESGAGDRIELTGRISPEVLRTHFQRADATILMSSREGMPNVILESLACGTPVLATAVGGIPEVVDRPEFGELADDRTAGGLLSAWRRLSSRRPCRNEIRRAAERFSWHESVRRLAVIYGEASDPGA